MQTRDVLRSTNSNCLPLYLFCDSLTSAEVMITDTACTLFAPYSKELNATKLANS